MESEQTYTKLPVKDGYDETSEVEELKWATESLQEQKPRNYLRLPCLLAFLAGIAIGVVLTVVSKSLIESISGAIHKSHQESKMIPQVVSVDSGFVISPQTGEAKCGNNWQDAKRLGCHFDMMASRWYSHDCYNGEVLEEMLQEVDFEWYADPQHTRRVSTELALSGEFDALWPLHDYHIMHCLYLWRRLHSAVIDHRQLDDDVYSYGHTVHCTRLIMNWHEGKNTTTIATSGIPYCRNEPL